MFRPVFHLTVVLINIYSMWYDQMYLDFPYPNEEYASMPFKARQVFLTIWCFMLQTLYFAISFLNDVIGTNEAAPKKPPLIRTIKDTLFSLAFPIALYVSSFFWAIYIIDRKSIFPDYIERIFPIWLNHSLHTLITLFLLIETFVTNRTYPSRTFGVFITLLFTFIYVVWMHIIHARNKMWPYPMFEVLNISQRMGYFAVSGFFQASFYIVGEKLDSVVTKVKIVPYVNGHAKKNS